MLRRAPVHPRVAALAVISIVACQGAVDRDDAGAATGSAEGGSSGAATEEGGASTGDGAPASGAGPGTADGTDVDATGPADCSGSGTGGGSDPSFVPEPGFHVTGDFAEGGVITITSERDRFGTRLHPVPWLWDTVASQHLAGVDLEAYVGLADGDPITLDVWTDQGLYQGWDEPEHKFKYATSSPMRHAFAQAQYENLARSTTDPKNYSKLAFPAWPDAWGPQNNAQMYLSWWQRLDGATPGYPQGEDGDGSEDKPLRFGDTELRGLGEFDITVGGLTATTVGFGNVKAWGSWDDPADAWHRIEVFVDRTAGIADLWLDGDLQIGSSWLVRPEDGGELEFRPQREYLYVAEPTAGTTLDTAQWENVTVHFLGFDDGGLLQSFAPGRNVRISEVYLDITRARVELSDAGEWRDAPDAGRTTEVQGRLLAWSPGEIQVHLHVGAFDTLPGRVLWVLDDAGVPIRIGEFVDVGEGDGR